MAVLPQMWRSRLHWALIGLTLLGLVVSLVLIWAAGAALGFGPLGQFLLEVAFYAAVGVKVLHPLARRYEEEMRPHVRAALADELMDLAEDVITPPRPRPVRPAQPRTAPD